MKKILAIMAAFSMVAAFSGSTFAEEKAAEQTTEAKEVKKASVRQITGEVTAVDTKASTVTVKGKKGESTCEVTADTKIKIGKEAKTLADVKVGDRVTCKHIEEDGKSICKSIKVKGAEKEEGKEEEEK